MKKIWITSVSILLLAGFSQAANLATWENDHLAGNEASTTAGESSSAGSYDSHLAAPVLSRGAGGTAVGFVLQHRGKIILKDPLKAW